MSMTSLLSKDTPLKVSSTLEKSVGKKNILDGSPETCWTSQQGLLQYIQLAFSDHVLPKRISLTFQGGFVGTRCALLVPSPDQDPAAKKEWQLFGNIYPEDVNRQQVFDLNPELIPHGIDSLKIVFEESSDFFGRITVYDLKLEGSIIQ